MAAFETIFQLADATFLVVVPADGAIVYAQKFTPQSNVKVPYQISGWHNHSRPHSRSPHALTDLRHIVASNAVSSIALHNNILAIGHKGGSVVLWDLAAEQAVCVGLILSIIGSLSLTFSCTLLTLRHPWPCRRFTSWGGQS